MNQDGLKLTAYFGERDRFGDRLLADELLDRYDRLKIETSILLRGIEGFGAKHSLHTDRLLSLSEDLPVIAIAIDRRERIEPLLDDLLNSRAPGLLSVESAQIVDGGDAVTLPPQGLDELTKMTVYIGRRTRHGREPLFVAICRELQLEGLAGATVLLGVDGTSRGQRTRARLVGSNQDVPLMLVSVGDSAQIARVLPRVGELAARPTITLERVRVCKRDGELITPPVAAEPTQHVQLMIHASESARHEGHPLHRSLVRKLRLAGVAGATTVRGIWGFHGDHAPHGDKLLQLHRHVPTVTTVIDTAQRITEAFAIVDETTRERGLVTSEVVPITRSTR